MQHVTKPLIATPVLTLRPEESVWVKELYKDASVILEYGSGGSTAYAAQLGGKKVFSVESDRKWMNNLQAWLDQEKLSKDVILHHADIGPTMKWGRPKDDTAWRKFPGYALSVWDREDLVQPDLVLVDGRFRVGCIMATLLRTKGPVTLVCDDYLHRTEYHVIEKFSPRMEVRGRMARFEISAIEIKPEQLLEIIQILTLIK